MESSIAISDHTILVAIAIFVVALLLIAVWLLIKFRHISDIQQQVQQLSQNAQTNNAQQDLVDRRLAQLLSQTSDDAATLREHVIDRIDALKTTT